MDSMRPTPASDPLTRFLDGHTPNAGHAAVPASLREYRAHDVGEREARFLEFRLPHPKMTVCLPYAQLVEINGEWRVGKCIMMMFARTPHPVFVEVHGENLQDLYRDLKSAKVTTIAEFDPAAHAVPATGSARGVVKRISMIRTPPAKPATATPAPR